MSFCLIRSATRLPDPRVPRVTPESRKPSRRPEPAPLPSPHKFPALPASLQKAASAAAPRAPPPALRQQAIRWHSTSSRAPGSFLSRLRVLLPSPCARQSPGSAVPPRTPARRRRPGRRARSEEHTSELQSHVNLVCRLLLEKKKKNALERSSEEKKIKIINKH